MKPISCIENDSKMKVTPFIGKQVDICETFGFEIPKGCAPKSSSEQKPKGKKGRPPKKKTEDSF
jgi:hypothetical protein